MTPSGIEPATFQFVARHLNHCATVAVLLYLIHLCVLFEQSLIFHLHLLRYNLHSITKIKPQIHHIYIYICEDTT